MFPRYRRRAPLLGAALLFVLPATASGQRNMSMVHPQKSPAPPHVIGRVVVPPVKTLPLGPAHRVHYKPVTARGKRQSFSAAGPAVKVTIPGQAIAAQQLLRNWETTPQTGVSPFPDYSCGAGPNNILVANNDGISWYDLNGSLQAYASWSKFLSDSKSTFYDPQVVYDAYQGHWILTVGASDFSTFGKVEILRSNASDPLGGWSGFDLDMSVPGDPAGYPDFPRLGLNDTTLYVSGSIRKFSDSSGFASRVFQLDSAAFEAATPLVTGWFYPLSNFPDIISPAVMRSPQSVPGFPTRSLMYMTQGYDGGGSGMDLWQMWYDSTTGDGDVYFWKSYTLEAYSPPPNGRQPTGPEVFTYDCRAASDSYVNGQLDTCIAVAYDPNDGTGVASAIKPIRFDCTVPGAGVKATRWYTVFTAGGYDLYYGAASVNADGETGFVMNVSSIAASGRYPSVLFGQIHSDGTLDPNLGLMAPGGGPSAQHLNLFGLYSGICLDPFDNKTWWGGGEFSKSDGTYGTWIGEMNNKPNTTLIVDSVSAEVTDTATLTAHLTRSDAGDPSGLTIAFKVDGADAGSGVTDAGGAATASFPVPAAMAAGGHTIDALFERTVNLNRSLGSGTLTVSPMGTSTVVPDIAGAVGQTVRLKAVVARTANGAGVSGAKVTIKLNGTTVGTPTTDASGLASVSYTIPDGATGAHAIAATYGGDAAHTGSSGSGTLTVGKADTTLLVANLSSVPGGAVTLSATLSRSSDGGMLSGKTVTFKNGSTVIGTGTTNAAGVATKSYTVPSTFTAPGSITITASFAGDANNSASSGTGTISVRRKTAITTANASGSVGTAVVLKGTLKAGSAAISGATITFTVDGASVGTGTTDHLGNANLTHTITEAAGSHILTVEFAGDTVNAAASANAALTVKKAATKVTGETLTKPHGSNVDLGAKLTRTTDNTPVVGRTLNFYNSTGTTLIGSGTTDATGRASVTVTAPAVVGTMVKYKVIFPGDAYYATSTGTASVKGN